jgi:N utilization substance protein A
VKDVYILDEAKHQALAVVSESQLSVAIGKQGLNVRLANRLCDWSIDVKTEEQFMQMDRSSELRRAVSELFGETESETPAVLADLPGMDAAWAQALEAAGVTTVEDFLALKPEQFESIEGIDQNAREKIQAIVDENVEVVEEETEVDEGESDASDEVYECPDCGTRVTTDMTRCPNCGVELSFEYEDE